MLSKWLMKRKLNRISKQLNKLTKEIIEVKGKARQELASATNNSLTWANYVTMRDAHIEKVITDIIKKEGK